MRQQFTNKNLLRSLEKIEKRLNELNKELRKLGYNNGNPLNQNEINRVKQEILNLQNIPSSDRFKKDLNDYREKEIPWEKNWKNGNLNFRFRAPKKNGRGFVWIVCYFEDSPTNLEDVTKEPLNATKTTPNQNQNQNQNGSISGLGVSPCGI
jgi:hypothetical protein